MMRSVARFCTVVVLGAVGMVALTRTFGLDHRSLQIGYLIGVAWMIAVSIYLNTKQAARDRKADGFGCAVEGLGIHATYVTDREANVRDE